MAKKRSIRKSSMRGKTRKNVDKQKADHAGFSYLILPKGVETYSPAPGKREMIDVVPYIVQSAYHPDRDVEAEIAVENTTWWKRPFRVHRNVGADEESIICLQSFGEKCPICEYRKKRAKEGADKDELKGYNSSARGLYIVIPKGHAKLEETYHIWDMSDFLFLELLNDEMEENEDFMDFPELEGGYTLKIRWNEDSFAGNKYASAGRIDFMPRADIDESVLDEVPCLDTVLKRLTYKELESKFFGMEVEGEDRTPNRKVEEVEVVEEEEDFEEEEAPKRKRRTAKKPEPVEEVEDEEEEEEEAPIRKRRTSKKAAPVEEEEEVEDEVEEVPDTDLTWEDLQDMDEGELFEVAEVEEIEVDDDATEEELRDILAEELAIERPAPPKKKRVTKKAAPVAKKEPVAKKQTTTKKADGPVCPGGGKFGVDTDKLKQCDACEIWEDCIDKKEGN